MEKANLFIHFYHHVTESAFDIQMLKNSTKKYTYILLRLKIMKSHYLIFVEFNIFNHL